MGLFSTTHIHQGRTEHVPYAKEINITEKRAPTDESVRLLNEMQEKAKENIIKTIKIDENHVKAVAIIYQDRFSSPDGMDFHIRFMLNGKEYTISESVDRFEWKQEVGQDLARIGDAAVYNALYKRFSEAIAAELIRQSPDFMRNVPGITR